MLNEEWLESETETYGFLCVLEEDLGVVGDA